jgi:hypothetical protein
VVPFFARFGLLPSGMFELGSGATFLEYPKLTDDNFGFSSKAISSLP